MQLARLGTSGASADRTAARRILGLALELGVNHIDTAQYYGPGTVNDLIREALYPYPENLVIVSKVGYGYDPAGRVLVRNEPHELRESIEQNLRRLKVDHLAAVNLRMPDPSALPDSRFEDQLAAMITARDDGLIGGVGLSNVSHAQLMRALEITDIVCVQNYLNLLDRESTPVLEACTSQGIAFVPYCPLGWPGAQHHRLLGDPVVVETAAQLDATPTQVALAWLLGLAPNVLLITGTSSQAHLEENLAAADLRLNDDATHALNLLGS
jgi:pyridoxine 4-dehydrogenase